MDNIDKLKDVLKMDFDGLTYYAISEVEKALQVNLSDVDYIEITIKEDTKKKKVKFVKSDDIKHFSDDRNLSDFNKALKKASEFNPNRDKGK